MKTRQLPASLVVANIALWLFTLASTLLASDIEKDPLFRAMSDELSRSVKKLRLENLEKPFYIEYAVRDYEWISVDASFGGLLRSDRDRERFLSVDLRVGDYSFDNTNYVGRSLSDLQPEVVNLVTEDNYNALRRQIWLATDNAYKNALEMLARKRAYVKGRTIEERPEDLSRERPFTYEEPRTRLGTEPALWERRIRQISAAFRRYPAIDESEVEFRAVTCNRYFLNSEGFKHRRGEQFFSLELTASTQAKDGMRLSNFATFYSKSLDDFPSAQEIARGVGHLAQSLTELAEAQTMESYVGPVLFQDQASCEFFNQLLGKNVSNPRSPLFEQERLSTLLEGGKLAGKLNRRVLPRFMNVVDDPTRTTWDGARLIGSYPVDDDGVAAQPVHLVQKGKLVGLLMSRIPTKEISKSNGHGRGTIRSPVLGNPGNLVISSEDELKIEQLKEELLSLCKDMDLEYGILVRRMGSQAFEEEPPGTGFFGAPRPELTRPILVYKVWVKDGKEELVRGSEFAGATVRAMKDIIATSSDYYVYNLLKRDRPGDTGIPISLVAPSILVEELELKRTSKELPKPPILPHPYFDLRF